MCLELVRKGGLIVIDNTLWNGKVIDENVNDNDTISIRDLNLKVKNDPRVSISMLGIADGLNLCLVL
jgi:predicted O-methyltransferase YrrM